MIPVQKTSIRRRRTRRHNKLRKPNFQLFTGAGQISVLPPTIRQQQLTIHKWSSPVELLQASADSFGTVNFKLADLFEVNHFQTIFQQYRFDKVEVFFRPVYRANPASLASAYIMPLIYVGVDTSDGGSWTTTNQARSYDSVIITGDNEPFMVAFKPQMLAEVFGAGVASPAGAANMWISTDDVQVRHYGVKFAITGSGALPEFQSYIVDYRATVSFRIGQ